MQWPGVFPNRVLGFGSSEHGLMRGVVAAGVQGGLSTFLHMDRVAARLKEEAPTCKKITGAPVV